MNLDLIGKNALVCGSSKGIGKASAIELAELGANVTLVARNEEALKSTLSELDTSHYQQHNYLVLDFSDYKSVEAKLQQHLIDENITYHILVNNTGGPAGGLAVDALPEQFLQTFNNHLLCNHVITKILVEGMKQSGYGRIINIISTSVKQPISGLGVSNTIRGAVANWAKTLAGELGQYGITVNNVLPGATSTDRMTEILDSKSKKTGLDTEAIADEMKKEIPMKRFAEPNEVAAAVAFLASPAASYINGINVPVDGGRTACL
jgi:3-oxoacyl-[acyl-carrier protein] reductase